MSRREIWLAGAALACCTALPVQAIVIDNFTSVELNDEGDSQWPVIQFNIGTVGVDESGLLGVIGGVRKTDCTLQSAAVAGVDFMQTSIVAGSGMILDYASSSGANGKVGLVYDGGGNLNANFSTELSIDVMFADFDFAFGNAMPVSLTLFDGVNSFTVTQSLIGPGSKTLSFVLAGFVGVNVSSIDSISLGIDSGQAADYRLVGINTSAIPAPGALALLGAAGLVARRRRRR